MDEWMDRQTDRYSLESRSQGKTFFSDTDDSFPCLHQLCLHTLLVGQIHTLLGH